MALEAANRALPMWRESPIGMRGELLSRLCSRLEAGTDELAEIITKEVGAPVQTAGPMQVGIAIEVFKSFAAIASTYPLETRMGESLVLREAVGVVGCITPWNLPLILIAQKVAPALLAGCTVVLKPSELTPFNALRLAQYMDEVGFPRGVFNVVTGTGAEAGEALVRSAMVDKISFTGSTRAGRRVAALAAETVKRVGLELGGKSASLVLVDADLETAIETSVAQACFNSGQSCIAWSRILIPKVLEHDAAEIAVYAASKLRVGDPRDPETLLGPLASDAGRERVRAYIRSGLEDGARAVLGGPEPPAGLERGYYVKPTVLAGVAPEMAVAREEIFGPVVSIIPYDQVDDAIAIANSTIYGLHGAVWSRDPERAMAVTRELKTGMVNINGYGFDVLAPFGGYKQSGLGRELGTLGLDHFFEVKAVKVCS
jgi:acyl-CoA reductase-like NAD-dependent aldehyde dehydrogenase